MIHVGNNTESQLDELLGRKERKWIWELGSILPMAHAWMMKFTVKTKGAEIVKSATTIYSHIFFNILTVFII